MDKTVVVLVLFIPGYQYFVGILYMYIVNVHEYWGYGFAKYFCLNIFYKYIIKKSYFCQCH